MKNQMKILTRHLLIRRAFREKCIFTDYNEAFLFCSNLKLYRYIYHVCEACIRWLRFIFVKCSCSRRDGTSLFSLFYKIIEYIQGSRLRPFFWECASKNLKWSHFVSHTARVSRAEAVQKQCVCRMGASARARRCVADERRIWFSN